MMQFSKRIGVALTAVAFCKQWSHTRFWSTIPLTTNRWTAMLGTRSCYVHGPVDEYYVPDMEGRRWLHIWFRRARHGIDD